MESGFRIVVGRVYRYVVDWPKGCEGGLYRVVSFIKDVPSYQEKVLVHCVSGIDKGLWFTCTPSNFSQRYEPLCTSYGVENNISDDNLCVDISEKGSGH